MPAGHGYYRATGGADGQPQRLNQFGQIVIRLEFTDGTHGLFRISPPVFGDGDEDGDLNVADFGLLENCWMGAGNEITAYCAVFDLDLDGDVDLADQAVFQQLLR